MTGESKQRPPAARAAARPSSVHRGPEPHSSAWFEALTAMNPLQAAMTGAAVRAAGREDCCTVCGDVPAPIYDVLEGDGLPVRLCTDCHGFQTEGFGLKVRPRNVGR